MDVVEFLKQFGRLCAYYSTNTHCEECPLYKYDCCRDTKNEDVICAGIVEQWAKEHPVKTRQSEFLKMFPNARIDDGVIFLGPCAIDNSHKCMLDCKKCCRDYWLKEIE